MKPDISRREFLGGCGAFAVAGFAPDVRNRGVRSYTVPVLGDIHFDSADPKFYHRFYTHSTSKARYRLHLAEHVRNAEMWKTRMPSLIRASASVVGRNAPFVLQMGDFVQGDCGKASVHRKMLDDAFAFVKGVYGPQRPFVIVPGNHDIRGSMQGDRARPTFEKWLLETMSRELTMPVTNTTFSFWYGPDVFIVADFNEPRPDFSLLKRLIAESEGARYTFLLSHGPMVPAGYSRWFLLGGEKRTGQRRELMALLARRKAIALGGHNHSLEYYDLAVPEGRIRQFVFNSVWIGSSESKLVKRASGARMYGTLGKCVDSLVGEYKPLIKDYFHASAVGHYQLKISDYGVWVLFFNTDSARPTRTFRLS